jgi:hypothetical protein
MPDILVSAQTARAPQTPNSVHLRRAYTAGSVGVSWAGDNVTPGQWPVVSQPWLQSVLLRPSAAALLLIQMVHDQLLQGDVGM